MYKLKPEQVAATLEHSTASVEHRGDAVVVAVVLRADPGWERIATLAPSPAGP